MVSNKIQTKYYLHVGLNKTGTSAIQDFFGKNKLKLIDAKVLYPDVPDGCGFAHHFIQTYPFEKTINELDSIIKRSSGVYEKVIFSSEAICRMPVSDLLKIIEVFPTKPIIIAYVRKVLDYYLSWYQYEVCYSNKFMRFGDFCELYCNHYKLGQSHVVENLINVCDTSGSKLCLNLYGNEIFGKNGILQDFFNKLDFPDCFLSAGDFEFSDIGYKHNQSVKGLLFYLKLHSNFSIQERDIFESNSDLEFIRSKLPKFSGTLQLPVGELDWIQSTILNDEIDKLNAILGVDWFQSDSFFNINNDHCSIEKEKIEIFRIISTSNLQSKFSKFVINLLQESVTDSL